MSYQRALNAWQQRTVEAPAYAAVERAAAVGVDPELAAPWRTRWAAIGLATAGFGFVSMMFIELSAVRPLHGAGRAVAVALPLTLLLWAATMLRQRNLARQMLVRAIAWSNLVIGVIVSVWGFEEFSSTGIPIVIGSGTCLLLLGTKGLGLSSGAFAPVAFRSQLLTAMVMACADAETLLFSGIVQLGFGRSRWALDEALAIAGPTLACGLLMTVAVWGLYRMRTWALFLNIGANLVIAALALHGVLGLTLPVAGALATTALVQLLLPVPILAIALGGRTPDRRPLGRAGPWVVRAVFISLMAAGIFGWMVPARWQDGAGVTYWRTGWVDRFYISYWRGL